MALERFRDVSPVEPFAHGIKPNFTFPLSPRVICLHSRIDFFLFWREGGAAVPAALHKLGVSSFQAPLLWYNTAGECLVLNASSPGTGSWGTRTKIFCEH